MEELNRKNLFRIMITTDNHIGFLEQDQIRGNDSFNTFEEILIKSKNENVDFILHGGDLFHHHNPSKKTIIRTSHILQKHIFGHKTHEFQTFCYEPNFYNDKLSIELPIFIIHGNHDDPSGLENFSSIDIYSGKEVNYFGKINNYEKFDLYPVLFVKGETKLAVYGIGNIKDERLFIALQNKKINFNRPEDYNEWFSILIVHQNRYRGHYCNKSRKNYLPENLIPSFFDLIIWGHEHESFTEAIPNTDIGFHIYQPGSSVATSLIAAEAKRKHVGIVEIYKNSFRLIPVVLETVRPFIYDQFELKEKNIKNSDDIERIIIERLEKSIKEASKLVKEIDENASNEVINIIKTDINSDKKVLLRTGYDYNNHDIYSPLPILPLIRLKIETSGHIVSRTNVILSKFRGLIANPHDVLQFYKKPERINKTDNQIDEDLLSNPHMYNSNLDGMREEEEKEEEDELKSFIIKSISEEYEKRHVNNYLFPDIFLDSLEKYSNGLDKKSLEMLFNTLYKELSFSNMSNSSISALNTEYLKGYTIDDSNISRKENYKHVKEIFKNIDFTFVNDKTGKSSLIENVNNESVKNENSDDLLFDSYGNNKDNSHETLKEYYDFENSLFDKKDNNDIYKNRNKSNKPSNKHSNLDLTQSNTNTNINSNSYKLIKDNTQSNKNLDSLMASTGYSNMGYNEEKSNINSTHSFIRQNKKSLLSQFYNKTDINSSFLTDHQQADDQKGINLNNLKKKVEGKGFFRKK